MVIENREELSKDPATTIVTSDEQRTSNGNHRPERPAKNQQWQSSTQATSNGSCVTSRVAFHTLGCKVNQFDTSGLITKFREQGYEIVDFKEPADIYIINTCTVTKTAEQKARQLIRKVKREQPGAWVVVTGCYAQTKAKALAKMPEIDLLVGVAGRSNLVDLVEEQSLWKKNKVIPWGSCNQFEIFTPEYTGKTRAFLKIEDGCESYCSYCKIPFARGPIRSLPPEQVKAEIRRMLDIKRLYWLVFILGNTGKILILTWPLYLPKLRVNGEVKNRENGGYDWVPLSQEILLLY